MNDIEAFEKWLSDASNHYADALAYEFERHLCFESWQAACEYKQKEIDELDEISEYLADGYNHVKAENAFLKENINGTKMKQMNDRIEDLLAENKKLREAIKYALEWSGDVNAWNRLNEALKELGSK
jgi:hypothetical protein